MRGRKPKPTVLKILEGNPGKRPFNDDEPKPRQGVPVCPAHLDAEAKKEWRRVTKELDACGLLTQIDRAALAAYCQAWSRWVEAEGKVKEFGPVLKSTDNGALYQNPYLSVANRAMDQLKAFMVEFGMSPASRSRVKVDNPAVGKVLSRKRG